jgi:DNA-binding PadR family transcriptional regulator
MNLNLNLFQSKNALLETKVEMLESKLKKQQELNAKGHQLAEELQKVREENIALGKKLEETEQKAQMAKNEVKNMARKFV